jgi:hypothetical protein
LLPDEDQFGQWLQDCLELGHLCQAGQGRYVEDRFCQWLQLVFVQVGKWFQMVQLDQFAHVLLIPRCHRPLFVCLETLGLIVNGLLTLGSLVVWTVRLMYTMTGYE